MMPFSREIKGALTLRCTTERFFIHVRSVFSAFISTPSPYQSLSASAKSEALLLTAQVVCFFLLFEPASSNPSFLQNCSYNYYLLFNNMFSKIIPSFLTIKEGVFSTSPSLLQGELHLSHQASLPSGTRGCNRPPVLRTATL